MRTFLAVMIGSVLSLAACRNDGPTTPTDPAIAMYTLVQFNGTTLPFTVSESASRRTEVISGTLTLRRDSSFAEIVNLQITPAAGIIQIVPSIRNGTFSFSDNTVQFRTDDGDVFSGTREGRAIAYSAGGVSFAFRRP